MDDQKQTEWPHIRIELLALNDGSPISLKENSIIVFTGGNNCGKSRVLLEIEGKIDHDIRLKSIILTDCEIKFTGDIDDKAFLESFFDHNPNGNYSIPSSGASFPLETLKSHTFIQAVDHMMRKYRKKAEGLEKKPVMIFCTDLPQQRDSKDSEWSKKENWERKRLAILECCEKNGVECLDLYTLCGFDMEKEPMFHAPTDVEHDNGVYYMDGLHPNPKGIDVITGYEIELMERLLKE